MSYVHDMMLLSKYKLITNKAEFAIQNRRIILVVRPIPRAGDAGQRSEINVCKVKREANQS